ncbi:MAG: hypothetical protein ACTSPV_01150 [Candidatus Hodarchaeales archaeon]
MVNDGWRYWEGKKVYIILKSKREYTGEVLEVEISSNSAFIIIKDKYGNLVGFNSSEVELIQEEEK